MKINKGLEKQYMDKFRELEQSDYDIKEQIDNLF